MCSFAFPGHTHTYGHYQLHHMWPSSSSYPAKAYCKATINEAMHADTQDPQSKYKGQQIFASQDSD